MSRSKHWIITSKLFAFTQNYPCKLQNTLQKIKFYIIFWMKLIIQSRVNISKYSHMDTGQGYCKTKLFFWQNKSPSLPLCKNLRSSSLSSFFSHVSKNSFDVCVMVRQAKWWGSSSRPSSLSLGVLSSQSSNCCCYCSVSALFCSGAASDCTMANSLEKHPIILKL